MARASVWIKEPPTSAIALGVQAASVEAVFRGYVLHRIAAWCSPGVAVVLSALVFAGLHLGVGLWGYLAILGVGVAAALSVLATGSIRSAIGLHVVNNFVGLALYGVGRNAWPSTEDAFGLLATFVCWLTCCMVFFARCKLNPFTKLEQTKEPEAFEPPVRGS